MELSKKMKIIKRSRLLEGVQAWYIYIYAHVIIITLTFALLFWLMTAGCSVGPFAFMLVDPARSSTVSCVCVCPQ